MSSGDRTVAPRYRVRLWCHDCGSGQDPMGCFEGDSELQDESYATHEEAEAAGKEAINGPPWGFEIEEDGRAC